MADCNCEDMPLVGGVAEPIKCVKVTIDAGAKEYIPMESTSSSVFAVGSTAWVIITKINAAVTSMNTNIVAKITEAVTAIKNYILAQFTEQKTEINNAKTAVVTAIEAHNSITYSEAYNILSGTTTTPDSGNTGGSTDSGSDSGSTTTPSTPTADVTGIMCQSAPSSTDNRYWAYYAGTQVVSGTTYYVWCANPIDGHPENHFTLERNPNPSNGVVKCWETNPGVDANETEVVAVRYDAKETWWTASGSGSTDSNSGTSSGGTDSGSNTEGGTSSGGTSSGGTTEGGTSQGGTSGGSTDSTNQGSNNSGSNTPSGGGSDSTEPTIVEDMVYEITINPNDNAALENTTFTLVRREPIDGTEETRYKYIFANGDESVYCNMGEESEVGDLVETRLVYTEDGICAGEIIQCAKAEVTFGNEGVVEDADVEQEVSTEPGSTGTSEDKVYTFEQEATFNADSYILAQVDYSQDGAFVLTDSRYQVLKEPADEVSVKPQGLACVVLRTEDNNTCVYFASNELEWGDFGIAEAECDSDEMAVNYVDPSSEATTAEEYFDLLKTEDIAYALEGSGYEQSIYKVVAVIKVTND